MSEANKILQAEAAIARFEADAVRYRNVAEIKSRSAEKWRRYLRRLKGQTAKEAVTA